MTRYTPLWEQAGSYAAGVDRHLISAIWPGPAVTGCAVTAVSGQMQVNVAPGAVAVPSQNATGSSLCVSDAVELVPIAAPPGTAGQSRIDLVTCHPRGTDLDGGTNNDFVFDTVQGVPAASPGVPATPAGQVALAQVVVAQGVVQIVPANITDVRPAQPLAVPPAQATGGVGCVYPGGGGTANAVTVTFPAGRFTAVPTVMATMNCLAGVWACVSNVTPTSVIIRSYGAGTVGASTQPCNWFATAAV